MPHLREVKFLAKHEDFKKGDITFLPDVEIAKLGKKVKVNPVTKPKKKKAASKKKKEG